MANPTFSSTLSGAFGTIGTALDAINSAAHRTKATVDVLGVLIATSAEIADAQLVKASQYKEHSVLDSVAASVIRRAELTEQFKALDLDDNTVAELVNASMAKLDSIKQGICK